eukprot:CAMPEP_0119129996 /NCGR_PEP_ID=MMETSP1310-20130426/7512_1 /TAXON_ID=464262 /ORGANISM="Genus nov. species nov., Strain RCC2339" /LENGTH=241 /DNA_ID=CAMNT_0007120459 /DNA_START=172 /DNA_END=897 /DNA_ORIENTATION=+
MATEDIKEKWEKEQKVLAGQLVCENGFAVNEVKYVGGVDISFFPDNDVDAVAAFVILEYPSMNIVYEDFRKVALTLPYIPGFLAFREVPHVLPMVEKLRKEKPEVFPDIIFVDGNGVLHPRGFGFASHLGVELGAPTIGIGKNLHCIDGLLRKNVRNDFAAKTKQLGDHCELLGDSGRVWGAAVWTSRAEGPVKPLYVSIGHMVDLPTAIRLTVECCNVRVPEPIRQADLQSRKVIRETPQ